MVRGSMVRIGLETAQNTKRGGNHGTNRVGNDTERGGNFSGIASEQVPLFENRFGTGFRVLAR